MFKELDPTNDLTFLRIRTKVRKYCFFLHILHHNTKSCQFYSFTVFHVLQKHEIMVAPDRDYILIVIQNTQDA